MSASSLCFPAAVLMAIVGMGWGILMAMGQDHTMMPAHAHLNLLGWVTLFLMGVFYRLYPQIDRSRAALAQSAVWIVGTIGLITGIALVHGGTAGGDPIAAISSLVLVADMFVFGILVVRGLRLVKDGDAGAARLAAAE